MYRPSELLGDYGIDSLMALNLTLTSKLISDQDHLKVGL
tara:strand:- start:31 stop:147 length:117 start_codon:yes stop_codon:yes gene_type:complete